MRASILFMLISIIWGCSAKINLQDSWSTVGRSEAQLKVDHEHCESVGIERAGKKPVKEFVEPYNADRMVSVGAGGARNRNRQAYDRWKLIYSGYYDVCMVEKGYRKI